MFYLLSPASPWESEGAVEVPDSPAPNVLRLRSSSSVGGRLASEMENTTR